MPFDMFFINSLAQFVALVALMVMVFVLRRSVNSRSLFIGFEALLLTVLLRRADEIAVYFGVDMFDRTAMAILSWIVIAILLVAFIRVWQRRVEIGHIVARLKENKRYAEALQQNGEYLQKAETL